MKSRAELVGRLCTVALCLSLVFTLALVLGGPVGTGQASTTIVVNSTEDEKKGKDGLCTLREAIIAANSDKPSGGRKGECAGGSGADVIILAAAPDPVTGTALYTLSRSDSGKEDAASTGDLDIWDDVRITAEGPYDVLIDGSGVTDRVFHIHAGYVEISGVTITNNSSFHRDGAGIFNSGTLVLLNSTVENIVTDGAGAGIYNAGVLTLRNSTIHNNTAIDGGGIANAAGGSVALSNSTVSGNTATNSGGGILNMGLLASHNSTIVNNNGAGVANSDGSGTVELRNTLIAGNGPDCSGTVSSLGHNLDSDGTCAGANGDITNPNPLLGPLQDNGGETATHALLPGSPAIDAGDPQGCLGTDGVLTSDQRGEPRPMDGDYDRDFRCDIGSYEAGEPGLVLIRAKSDGTVDGRLSSAANRTFTLDVFSTDSCPAGSGPVEGATLLDPVPDPGQPIQVDTDDFGNVYFTATVTPPEDTFVYGRATIVDGTAEEFSRCIPVGWGNVSWPNALSMDDQTSYPLAGSIDQYIDQLGQSRWYKFSVEPLSEVIVTLTGVNGGALPANYDLTIYKDIAAAFYELIAPLDTSDLVRLGAEFAGDAFSGDAFSGDAFSGDAFSGDAFSGDAFSGDAFSGDAFSGDAFSGDAFSGDAFSGDAFSGDAFSGDAFSGDAFSGDAFSGDAFSGDAFSGDAFSHDAYNAVFSSAPMRSLLGVSAFEGTASEGIRVNTWSNTGEYYVRVRGRNGAFSLDAPFRLSVTLTPGDCGSIEPLPDGPAMGTEGNNPTTLIVTDLSRWEERIEGTEEEKAYLLELLESLAQQPEVDGKIIDVSLDPRVNFANGQADGNPTCPFAKNLVGDAIKDIIDGYREQESSALEYILIVGGDEVVPFARIPDDALLANEQNYYPPVLDNTPSQASLRLGYVLTQDVYGSGLDLSLNNSTFPVPELAVGRLVETATDMSAVLDAFLQHTDNGVVTPQTSLVTGYDFLYDAAVEIRDSLEAGTGTESTSLLTPSGGPGDPDAWTADDLRSALLPETGEGPDIAFLAGHFTGNSALAADYTTRLLASEAADSAAAMTNSIIFSIGCHAGYNIVNQHDIPNVTREPDWAQAFASRGATLVAGTGYQYGDTDLLRYSESLYLEFSRQLQLEAAGGPVSIGQALVEAKKAYLKRTPHLGSLDEKALLEATIFGLPMLKVDLNRGYVPPTPDLQLPPVISLFLDDPGHSLGLEYGDITVTSPLIEHWKTLVNIDPDSPVEEVDASYLEGSNGFDVNPGEPILPLEVRDVTREGTVLRGVGFRGGIFAEVDLLPLISSATTEMSGVHTPFLTDFLYPIQTWTVNYFDALAGGKTLLMVTPAQHRTSSIFSEPQESTRRQFSAIDLRLYYSSNTTTFTGDSDHPSTPAGSVPPSILRVSDVVQGSEVTFSATVVGNPSAGIQEVWATYVVCDPNDLPTDGQWQSLDLVQSAADSTLWETTRTLAELGVSDLATENVCYMVQAVNGVGLVSRADNLGLFFRVDVDVEPTVGTSLVFLAPAPDSSGPFGTKETFRARLSDQDGQVLDGQVVTFRLGGQARRARTHDGGFAEVDLALIGEPGAAEVKVSFAGAGSFKPSDATLPFTIVEQATVLSLHPNPASGLPEAARLMTATLETADGRALFEKTVVFEVAGIGGVHTEAAITDFAGRAFLGGLSLPRGDYSVDVSFDLLYTGLQDDPSYGASTATGLLRLLNTPPDVEDDAYTIDTYMLTIAAPGVLSNDSDYDGDPLTAILFTAPEGGSVTLGADGSFHYLPDASFGSYDTFAYKANDGFDDSAAATVTITPSVCFFATATIVEDPTATSIWPPNGEFKVVEIHVPGAVETNISDIYQDEKVGKNRPDARIIDDSSTVELRAERDGKGNGRTYHIFFTATDAEGNSCQGHLRLPVMEHDQSGDVESIDEGPLYDSTAKR
jgi:pentapeptide MXKDX repeat protein